MSAAASQALDQERAPWIELLRGGRAFFTILVVLSALVQALQMLVIAIIMPTVVADIGGAAYFTWPAMLYTVGAIVGSVCVGRVWMWVGPRAGYLVAGGLYLIGTISSAFAPDMAVLVIARTVQGFAGGLVMSGTLAFIGTVYDERLRPRALALSQVTWTTSHLMGPLVGGVFAQIGWWRGSFWVAVPMILIFMAICWWKVPKDLGEEKPIGAGAIPLGRLGILGLGVFCLAMAGPVTDLAARAGLIAGAAAILIAVFHRDRSASNPLFPVDAWSLRSAVGLAIWVLFLTGAVQNSITLFLPLLLQVVHKVTPLFINFVTIVISAGWTVGAIATSGFTGTRERFVLWFGPMLMIAALCVIVALAEQPYLGVLTAAAFAMGFGIGIHNILLVSRTLQNARPGEEKLTASAIQSCRSLGTAFGAAVAGVLANVAGLTDVTDPAIVGHAVSFIYSADLIPLVFAAICMVVFSRIATRPLVAAAAGAE
jgi:MFS family permease